jgi:hypothetical protein
MFWEAYCSSSGALTEFAVSGLHTHVVTGRSQVPTQTWLRPVTTCIYKPEDTNTVRTPDDERMPLETCWAFNERWNNKLYYKVASCWLFLLSSRKKCHLDHQEKGSMKLKLSQFTPGRYKRGRVIVPVGLFGDRWMYVVNLTPRSIYPDKSKPQFPKRPGGWVVLTAVMGILEKRKGSHAIQ